MISGFRTHYFTAVVLVASALSVNAAHAQGTRVAVEHQQVVSASPFLLMFKWFNVDYERKINEYHTWGASTSFLSLDDDEDYVNAQLAYRFYPQRAALTGFYLGGRGGFHNVDFRGDDDKFFGLGFELGYNWLLGSSRRFSISVGGGATRLFGGDLSGASLTIPTVRLMNLGVAF